MNIIEIKSKARDIADSMLPDPTVIEAHEDAEVAAVDIVEHWEVEARKIGQTLGDVDASDVPELRRHVTNALIDRILGSRDGLEVRGPDA